MRIKTQRLFKCFFHPCPYSSAFPGMLLMLLASIFTGVIGIAHSQETMPRVAVLAPASSPPHNIFLIDPAHPEDPEQVTFSTTGIYDFGVSPAGSQIAFAEKDAATGDYSLQLLDLDSTTVTSLGDCSNADCRTPVWRSDGTQIAYERTPTADPGHMQIWLLNTAEATTAPLLDDFAITGRLPHWSPDGRWLAFYSDSENGIILFNMATGEWHILPTLHGAVGTFSPASDRYVYPDLVLTFDGFYAHMKVADLTTRVVTPLAEPDRIPIEAALPAEDDEHAGHDHPPLPETTAIFEDERALWWPNGESFVITRRYLDERYTPGRQLYRVALATGDTKPLLVDEAYFHGFFAWNPDQTQLVIQRFEQPAGPAGASPVPEIWVYDVATREVVPLMADAFLPQWVP